MHKKIAELVSREAADLAEELYGAGRKVQRQEAELEQVKAHQGVRAALLAQLIDASGDDRMMIAGIQYDLVMVSRRISEGPGEWELHLTDPSGELEPKVIPLPAGWEEVAE